MSLEEARRFFSKKAPNADKGRSNRSRDSRNHYSKKDSIRQKMEKLEKQLMFSDLDDGKEAAIMEQIERLERQLK